MSLENSNPLVANATSGIVVPQPLTLRRRIAATAVYILGKSLMASWKCEASIEDFALPKNSPIIFGVWHNRLAISMVAYSRYARKNWPSAGLAAMISASKDGGLLAAVLKKFGVQAVRGSTSRRGRQALLESTTWLEKGFHIAITPDGPRGPRYQVQDGIIALAQITGAPIVPVSAVIRLKIILRSWDRFQLPLPFARCTIRFGKPVFVPRNASDEIKEKIRGELQQTMMATTAD